LDGRGHVIEVVQEGMKGRKLMGTNQKGIIHKFIITLRLGVPIVDGLNSIF